MHTVQKSKIINLVYTFCVLIVAIPTLIAVFECLNIKEGASETYTLKAFHEHLSVEEERCYKKEIPFWIDQLNSTDCNLEKPMCPGEFRGTKWQGRKSEKKK